MPHFDHLICPVCRQGFTLTDKSVRCPKGHTFDLARQGYLNLHLSPVKTKYTKDLYQARRRLFQSGVFDPLVACLSALLLQHRSAGTPCSTHVPPNTGMYHDPGVCFDTNAHTRTHTHAHTHIPSLSLLDAGCGDGSLLAAVTQTLSEHNHAPLGLGIDLCKDAVKIASHTHPSLTWCVADLARPPIADRTQDIILNILAPANYAEFKRLLKPDGMLVKVLPGPSHFQEIRQALASQHTTSAAPDTPPS
ncbi:MAG: methyltransferase domain-containing protein, partial [Peptococcaceae bacterium]|nr:methyltransferase domain-containing protein [Peptococcaceae bacterium]